MNNTTSKLSLLLMLVSGFVWLAIKSEAYPPFLRQAAKFGAKDCSFCHADPQSGGDLNARGKWLKSQRDKRSAERIDVEWLAEYKDKNAASPAPKAEEKSGNWAEMESFHEVMSETFHPAEDGKLEPIRTRANELAEKAKLWLDSKPPKSDNTKEIKALLTKLSTEAKALADSIANNATDEQVKKDLTALHNRYHEIIEARHDEKGKKK